MGRGNRAYKSEKRSKELRRIKKQEAKRLRRLQKGPGPPLEGEEPMPEGAAEAGETPEGESPEAASDDTSEGEGLDAKERDPDPA